jgi:ribonuclease HII
MGECMGADRIVGIDENGLGPRLGPLSVTSVVAEIEGDGASVALGRPSGRLAERIGDSKALVSHGHVALGEAWARGIASQMGLSPESPDELFTALSLDDAAELLRSCPDHVRAQCWGVEGERFEADEALVQRVAGDLAELDALGVRILQARTAVICTKRLNDALAVGRSRLDVDLHAMERLILHAASHATGALSAVCGKVGGYTRYAPAFGPLAGRLYTTIAESAERSAYHFPGVGTIAFVRDADASHLLVAVASLVGKWVRELLMARIVRYYGTDGASHRASGYHDPVTARFVEATADARLSLRVFDDCFERASERHERA